MKPVNQIQFAIAVFLLFATQCLADERLVLVAGGGEGGDGSRAQEAKLQMPFGVEFDPHGNMVLVEFTGHRVRLVDTNGIVKTLAGTGMKGESGDGGPALQASFNGIHNLAIARSGEIYLADTWNQRVRKIDPKTGIITTVVGTGKKGFSGDGGPAHQADFGAIYCVALDPSGKRMYLADLDNRRIRMVDITSGIVSTVAGNGEKGIPKDDGDARSEPLVDPRAVAADAQGNVYILERSGHALRVVDAQGKIRTVAGTGKAGLKGDGGLARNAMFNGPKHLYVDHDGNVLIADTENHVIRKYLPRTGNMIRVAGTGKKGAGGLGGSPLQAELNQPHGVYVHANGMIYIADSTNNRIVRIEK